MAQAVIGAAFGDEGKGLLTDALCEYSGVDVVVRYNGGAQAGHTVTHGNFGTSGADGKGATHQIRHVFHHFGSGTLRGAFTYLGRRFVTNPILFRRERLELIELTEALRAAWPELYNEAPLCAHSIYADPRSQVTTPYDMLINEMLETKRGGGRHGSCGIGFGETIERSETNWTPPLSILECSEETYLRETLEAIRKEWVPYRMDKLGLKPEDDPLRWEYMNSKVIAERWIEDAVDMRTNHVCLQTPREVLGGCELLFEGAQGLLLDQDHEFFPHVTRSKTGGAYIREMTDEFHKSKPSETIRVGSVHYVMRSYMTRHGAGPFPTELGLGEYYRNDRTNVPNDWQGSIRQGTLDLPLIKKAIDDDFVEHFESADADVFVTWMDHPSVSGDTERYLNSVGTELEADVLGYSDGPSRDDVNFY